MSVVSVQLCRLCRHSCVDSLASVRECSTTPERTGKHTFVSVEAQLEAVGELGWGQALLGLDEWFEHLWDSSAEVVKT